MRWCPSELALAARDQEDVGVASFGRSCGCTIPRCSRYNSLSHMNLKAKRPVYALFLNRLYTKGGLSLALVLISVLLYCVSVWKVAHSRAAFIDEGWIAAPGYDLAFHGKMGSPGLEPTGSWLTQELKGIQDYTYWIMPLDPVAQAGWYRLFGFGLIQMRMLSAVWGLVALLAWSAIVWIVSGDCVAAGLTAFLISVDFTFLWCPVATAGWT